MKRRYPSILLACFSFLILMFVSGTARSQATGKSLVLQEMTWTDVKEYLSSNDMAIIPLGSTEQHGPHLPLGTDYLLAMAISKEVSARTGVVVAPVLLSGYSVYHDGFPGTLSLKPETMEQVLFETAEMLIKYGIRRLMFLNEHGGNDIVQRNVIHRINHETEATAVEIGYGSPIHKLEEGEFFDSHAGVKETSLMLHLEPTLVRMERAQRPDIHFTPRIQELRELSKKNPNLEMVLNSLFAVPAETKKGGASHELSSNGIWTLGDPRSAEAESGQKLFQRIVDRVVNFIEAWKSVRVE